jgi:hypothetical protein
MTDAGPGDEQIAMLGQPFAAASWRSAQDRASHSNQSQASLRRGRHIGATGREAPDLKCNSRRMIMKSITSALIALSVLTGIATPASADRPFGSSDQGPPLHYVGGY